MSRYLFVLLIICVILGVGCREQSLATPSPADLESPTSQPFSETTPSSLVTLSLAVPSTALRPYQQLVALFEEAHPSLSVNVIGYDGVENQPRDRARQADVFFYYPTFEPHDNALLDLQALIENDPSFDRDDFWSGTLPESGEAVWALPTAVSYQLIFYDKIAFDEAGIPYPPLDWTFDDFVETARTLTVRDGDEVTRWGYVSNQVRRDPLLASHLTNPLIEGEVERLTDPDVAEAITSFSALFTEEAVAPWLDTYKPVDQQPVGTQSGQFSFMNNGRAAMWQRSHPVYVADDYQPTVGATAIPTAGNGLTAEPILEGFAISQGTQHREVSWQLLKFLTTQPPIDQLGLAPLPARRSVTEASDYWTTLPDEVVEAVRYSAENSRPPLFWPDNQLIPQAVTAVVAGVTVGEALSHLLDRAPVTESTAEPIVVATAPATNDNPAAEQILFSVHRWDYDRLLRLAEVFNREQSDIVVTLNQYNGDSWELLADIQDTDCLAATAGLILTPENHHMLLPVESLFELDGELDETDFFPVTIEMMRYDETLYGVPAWTEFLLIQYNRQLFSDNQIPEPRLNWTMEEFLSAAIAVTEGEGEDKTYAYAEGAPIHQLFYALLQFQPQFLDNSTAVPTVNFAAAAPMLQWYADLVYRYEVQPVESLGALAPESFARAQNLLNTNRLAMWPAAIISEWSPLPGEMDTGFATIPIGPSGVSPSIWHAHGHFILANSEHRVACWEWIRYLSTSPSVMQDDGLPARIDVAQSDETADILGQQQRDFYLSVVTASDEFRLAEPLPPWINTPVISWLRTAFTEVITENRDITLAINEAQAKFDAYRECAIANDAFDNFPVLHDCVLQVDPDAIYFAE